MDTNQPSALLPSDDPAYLLISRHYRGRAAARSQQSYMKHIDEGLEILSQVGAPRVVQRAYALHPIFQSAVAQGQLLGTEPATATGLSPVDLQRILEGDHKYEHEMLRACLLARKYAATANSFLPRHHTPGDPASVPTLSRFPEVNLMLYADKVQNQRDFKIYHADSHPRAALLADYFETWLAALRADNPALP